MRKGLAALALATTGLAPFLGGNAQASGGGGGGGGNLNLVPMEEITVPIVESDRMNGELRLKVVLEAQDAAASARLTEEMPKLREATVAAALEFARLYASGLRAVDAVQLDHDLTSAAKAADGGVARVLIVEVAADRG